MGKGTEILKVRKGRKLYICTSLLTTGTKNSSGSQDKQELCFGSKNELKYLICLKQGPSLEITFVCLLYNVIMSDSKPCNINK